MAITVSTSPQNITASVGETQIDVTVSGGIGPSGTAGASNWNDITGKPSTFTPSSHTHDYVDVAGGSTFTNFLTTAGNLSVALSDIDSALTGKAAAADFDQGLKTTDDVLFYRLAVNEGPYITGSGGANFRLYDGDTTTYWILGETSMTFPDASVQTTAFVPANYATVSHAHSVGDISFTATDRLLGRSSSGAGVGEEITCTSAGRALLDDADAAAQRSTLSAQKTITSGTAAPTGGSDGDIYLQYTA